MKILAIVSSVNKDGKTAASARSLIEGAEAVGADGSLVFLTEMDQQRCRQCDSEGWRNCRYMGRCIIEDDFQKLVEEIREADIIVFATPVYFSDMSESIRGVLERLRRTCITEKGSLESQGNLLSASVMRAAAGVAQSHVCTTWN